MINNQIARSHPGRKKLDAIIRSFDALWLKSEIKICVPPETLDEIIEARIHGKVFLLLRKIKCGKGCGGCPHGPYWYGFYKSKGKTISFYLGSSLPPRFIKAKKIKVLKEKNSFTISKGGDQQ